MIPTQRNKHQLKQKYEETYPKYERLAKNIKQALEIFLVEEDIDVLSVEFRIKEFESFYEKIERKKCKEPYEEIEDICGLRVVCSYTSDLDRVSEVLRREFTVIESVDKTSLLRHDQFGYRSWHFIVKIKNDWLEAPNYRGLEDLKVEIQVRTILMHAWADIQHKLAYKKKEHIPDQILRTMSQLCAILENADNQLEQLRKERADYIESLTSNEAKVSGRFDISQPMNMDTLLAFLDFYFPDRDRDVEYTRHLLDEILQFRIGLKDLVEGYESTKHILRSIEEEEMVERGTNIQWAQVGIVRAILDLTNNEYYEYRYDRYPDLVVNEKWRREIKK